MSVSRRAGLPHFGTIAVDEIGALVERIAGAVRHAVFGQHDRQVLFRHRHVAAIGAVDDRDRRAPVALAGNTPVAQAVGDLLFAQTLGAQLFGDVIRCLRVVHAVERTGIDAHAILGCVPFLPGPGPHRMHTTPRLRRIRCLSSARRDHLPDRKAVLLREREIALVVPRHAHHARRRRSSSGRSCRPRLRSARPSEDA